MINLGGNKITRLNRKIKKTIIGNNISCNIRASNLPVFMRSNWYERDKKQRIAEHIFASRVSPPASHELYGQYQ